MPLEQAVYISSLVASNPASTDTVSQADDHIRLIKKVLKDTFPNINSPVTATPSQINSGFPVGFIGMWSGSIVTIPSGWGLCDGTSGRPDLRDRFIVGAGNTYSIGSTGGANTVGLSVGNLPSHSHTFSGLVTVVEAGAHNHSAYADTVGNHAHTLSLTAPFSSGGIISPGTITDGSAGGSTTTAAAGAHSHAITVVGVGNHNHTASVSGTNSSVGSGEAHENRPPYFALAFIIKL